MELWNHCENPYPFVPAEVLDEAQSVRASLPNKYCDPQIAARLYDEIFDEYRLCDDLGLHIVTNEHHSGINNLWAASPVITGVVARLTRKVRILSLGTLITVRPDPVRIAEEYATIDVLSKGRLEIGFVKSGATEMVSGDANPMRIREREWEAIDLIEKALVTHDGPFSWEGKFFIHPHVNIWPRPYQQPRPEFWAATSDLPTCAELGRRGIINTLLFGGYDRTRQAFDAYKQARARGRPRAARRGPVFLHGVLLCRRQRRRRPAHRPEDRLVPHRQHQERAAMSPNSSPARWRPRWRRRRGASGVSRRPRPTNLDAEVLVGQGQMFAGNPDTVARQIKEFRRRVGGIRHIIMMTRQGLVTHAEAQKSFTLAAQGSSAATAGPAADRSGRDRVGRTARGRGCEMTDRPRVGDIDLEVLRRGSGRPILLIHGVNPVSPKAPFLDRLAEHGEIIAPSHPGFGDSPRPEDFDTMYDLVQLYREVLDALPGPALVDRLFVRRLDRRRGRGQRFGEARPAGSASIRLASNWVAARSATSCISSIRRSGRAESPGLARSGANGRRGFTASAGRRRSSDSDER